MLEREQAGRLIERRLQEAEAKLKLAEQKLSEAEKKGPNKLPALS